MLAALSLSGAEAEAVNTANAQLLTVLTTAVNRVTLSIAESLWVDSRRATLRPEYVHQTQAWCHAALTDLDFSGPGAVAQINRWAAQETDGRITHSIDRIDPTDVALLLNAAYFKGQWALPFDPAQTQQRDFTLAGGAVKQVPLMTQSARLDYFETPTVQAVRLNFGDGDLVMDIFLPAAASSLRELEAQMTPEHWADWKLRYAPRPGTLELPRFELTARYHLNKPLQTLGMRRVFERDAAQLTGMVSAAAGTPTGRFFIGSVLQSTYWKVDEEGAMAAAVTSVGVRATAIARPLQPFRMSVDRPFFCAIEDRRSGALLFVGAIYDPAP
jgi:serpin B